VQPQLLLLRVGHLLEAHLLRVRVRVGVGVRVRVGVGS
jgi:hypothetical protein